MDEHILNVSGSRAASQSSATSLITKFKAHSALAGQETGWLVRVMILGMDFPGFLSAEIIPPYDHNEWWLLQRFRQPEQVVAWRDSEARLGLMKELALLLAAADQPVVTEEVSQGERGSVATAIVTRVKAGMESEYRIWEGKVQVAQAKFPGYRGSYVQPPTSDAQAQWTTMLRFDTPETLEKWFNSDERKSLLEEGSKFVRSTDFKALSSSFPGWFPTDANTGEAPAVWKTFMLVVLTLFPIVMLEIRFLMPLLKDVPSAPANLIGNLISVALTTWITIPASIKVFSWWLLPAAELKGVMTDLKGAAFVCLLYAAEVAFLWHLLG